MSVTDTETDVETGTEQTPRVPLNEQPVDGPGSGRSEIRRQLEKNFETDRRGGEQERGDRRTVAGKTARGRKAEEPERGQEQERQAEGQEQEEQAEGEQAQAQTQAPEAFSKEAKAEWANTPSAVQAAITKREQDVTKGVAELKKTHADVDAALAPRIEYIKRFGHSPAQAIDRLFLWFEALHANPHVAFPALARSFNFDLASIIAGQQAQQPTQQQSTQQQNGAQQQQEQPLGDVPPAVQQYINRLESQVGTLRQEVGQQLGNLQQTFAMQSQQKTEEMLGQWAKGKPYFEEVRQLMANLIGNGAVPPLPNGAADLDKAYDMALWALPDVRSRIQSDQKKAEDDARRAKALAEKKAQQEQADKARRAAGSIASSAPGTQVITGRKQAPGKSVRDSLKEAMEELGS